MSSKPWSYADLDLLYREYSRMPVTELAEKLDRTVQAVESKAVRLNLHRNTPFTSTEHQYAKMFGKELNTALIFLMPDRSISEVEVLLSCES